VHASKAWRRGIASAALGLVVLGIVIQIVLTHAGPILKGRVVETLRARFHSEVQLDSLQVGIGRGLEVTGSGLRIFPPDDQRSEANNKPIIAIEEFHFRASPLGLFFKPTHVRLVTVRGLAINVPPASQRQKEAGQKRVDKVKIKLDEIVCDDSQLVIGTDKPDKDARVFLLKHIVLRDLGPNTAWPFDAILTNPIPKGEIHASGTFGPWVGENPGGSKVTGKYLFEHADMNTIKGIGGELRSTGSFDGQLNRIGVRGKVDVPDFSLDTANHPMPLSTEFQAVVDGTSGDTYLENIQAKLGSSEFSCQGAVIGVKGQGHKIDVKTDVPDGQIADFLGLAVKTNPAPMTGHLNLQAELQIAPGTESVTQKMTMHGAFTLRQIHFTNPSIEDKVDLMSLRAQGKTDELKPGAPDVTSRMTGKFAMEKGDLEFSRLDYSLPGGEVRLTGHYAMDGRQYEFAGKVRTKAEVSEMVASKWKSVLLKPIDPVFSKHGWGTEVPIKVSSDKDGKPKFGFPL
jgi:AsmA-like C-terminal region